MELKNEKYETGYPRCIFRSRRLLQAPGNSTSLTISLPREKGNIRHAMILRVCDEKSITRATLGSLIGRFGMLPDVSIRPLPASQSITALIEALFRPMSPENTPALLRNLTCWAAALSLG